MAGEQFSLCWDNFHKNMSSGMHSLLESGDLVDVTLAVEGKYLKAHKMVLSVCSPYFRELFQNNPCKHPIMFMKDVSYIAMSDLLTFMYQGEVQVNQEHLATFIKTAEALQIKGLTGDGNGDIGDVAEDIQNEKPSNKRAVEVETEVFKPTHRPKKSSSGSIKRQRLNTSSVEAGVPKVESQPAAPSTEQIIQFKMEPYETGDQSHVENLEDSQGDNYAEETVDDSQIEDPEDYSMLEGEEEPQVGTSGDGMGDSQDVKYSIGSGDCLSEENSRGTIKKKRSSIRRRFVNDGFVYHTKVTAGSPPIGYLGCSQMKKNGCKARAILPVGATCDKLRVTKPHNHPPDKDAHEKEMFVKNLKRAAQIMPGSLKKVYEEVALLYPIAAREVTFKSLCSSMHRWRKAAQRQT